MSDDIVPIPNALGYGVSRDGRFWSRFTNSGRLLDAWKPLAGKVNGQGYRLLALKFNGVRRTVSAHRIVLEVFLGPCPECMECCHGPLGRLNNSLENLSWGTHAKNCGEDKHRDGKHGGNRGEKHGLSKLRVRDVKRIWRLRRRGLTQRAIAEKIGVSEGCVWSVLAGKRWAWLNSSS